MTVVVNNPAVGLSAVSGAGNSDGRQLAPWFASTAVSLAISAYVGYSGKSLGFVGDSTAEQLGTTGLIGVDGAWLYTLNYKLAAAAVKMYVHGSSGESLVAAASRFATLAAYGYDAYVPCWGINDCRTDATIIGSYGSAGQIAKAQALQAGHVAFAAAVRAVKPSAVIVLRMPNAHALGSIYFANSVTAQHCMDVYRLAWRGDAALGVPSMASLIPNSICYDTLSRLYNDTAYLAGTPTNARIDADRLHGSVQGYRDMISDLTLLLSSPLALEMAGAPALLALGDETTRTGHSVRPDAVLGPMSDAYVQIGTATVLTTNASYFDATFDLGGSSSDAWGAATSANYGSAKLPALHVDDVIVWYPAGKPRLVMPVRRMASSNNSYLRWSSGGPDGYYPTAAQLATGDSGYVLRRRDLGSYDYAQWMRRVASASASAYPAYAYAFSVNAANTTGGLEIRGMPPFNGTKSLVGKTITATDRVILPGVTPVDGLLLTGLTWTPHGSEPGRGTISGMTGVDFTKYAIQQGVILSST